MREEKNKGHTVLIFAGFSTLHPAPISPQCFLSADGGTELQTADWKVLPASWWSQSTEHSVTDLCYFGIKLLVLVSLLFSILKIPPNKDHPTILCCLPKILILNLRAKCLGVGISLGSDVMPSTANNSNPSIPEC